MSFLNNPKFQIAAAVIFPNLGGFVNGRITAQNLKPWYASLNKPSLNPPNWVFGPVWTSLYAGMGYASYLVYRDGGGFSGNAQTALTLYGAQLILNHAWTPIFFKYHSMKWSSIEIVLLTGTAAACGYSFYQINPIAGQLFIPYLAWLSFASFLNYTYYKLNPVSKPDDPKAVKSN
ncbi:Translocator protein [Pseudolycoriella hygida]|uniref:Translocator protein n=1 Tax=Pseudolycoriella hygida TaxID=35572 RepID=A0A9Q0MTF3_9DIPT|nr:Translocator protein [Pseudolycoriella hygida]